MNKDSGEILTLEEALKEPRKYRRREDQTNSR